MSSGETAALAPASPAERDAVVHLAQLVLRDTAPAELTIFDHVADEYFDDPDTALSSHSREEAIGFGLDLALVTPVLLAVATSVVRFLSSFVADAARDEASAQVARWMRRLLTRDDGDDEAIDDGAEALDVEQARRVHDVARNRAVALGMGETDADVLADAIVGRLVIA